MAADELTANAVIAEFDAGWRIWAHEHVVALVAEIKRLRAELEHEAEAARWDRVEAGERG